MAGAKALKNFLGNVIYGNNITFVVRLLLGGLFLFSGVIKLFDPDSFGRAIVRYDILPHALVGYAAVVIPVLEMLAGLLLLIGYKVRAASLVSVILMAVFIPFIAVNIFRGRSFDCGCFDARPFGLELHEEISVWLLVRDCIILAGFALLFRAERHLFSIENYREKLRLQHLEKTKYQ